MNNEGPKSRGCGIVTIGSTLNDELTQSGALVRDALLEAGHHIIHQRQVSDSLTDVRYLFRDWVDDARVEVIVAIGGVGVKSREIAPEALSTLMTKFMPGFGEIYRQLLFAQLGVSALEIRALAAVCHSTVAYLIPERLDAVEIAVSKLIVPQLRERLPMSVLRTSTMPPQRIPGFNPTL
jgi:molybdenum cofactor biosynthesis protein B